MDAVIDYMRHTCRVRRLGKEHMHADDLVLCSESEEDLRAMVGQFVEMCRRRDLKVNEDDGTEWRGRIRV